MLLSDSIWWTRQSRIRTERRLLSNAFHSQLILLWYSFYSVAASIYYIGSQQSETISKYWLIYSVLVLIVSGFINGFSYKERASQIKENYESLKKLYAQAKEFESKGQSVFHVQKTYEEALKKCENHSPMDYLEALYDTYQSTQNKDNVSPHPTEYQIRIAKWNRIKRTGGLFIFYIFPLAITFFFNNQKNGDELSQLIIGYACK